MSIFSPIPMSTPRRLPLVACLTATLSIAASAAAAGPVRPLMRQPAQLGAAALQATLPFARIATTLTPGASLPSNPSATPHHVTSCNDDPNDPGSLRSIIAAAGTVSGDHIDFAQLPMLCSTITLDSVHGALKILQNTLYLDGPGAENLTIDAGNTSQATYHFGAGTLYISGLTVANGQYTSSSLPTGGCIDSEGHVFLLESKVTHCTVKSTDLTTPAKGGGIYARGNLTLVRSTISDSHSKSTGAMTYGGGAYAGGSFFAHDSTVSDNEAVMAGALWVGGDIADIERSTFSRNQAAYVGAIEFAAATGATIANSTISGNTASLLYGGIWTGAPLTLSDSTVAFNHVIAGPGVGSGLYSNGAPLTLRSSIVADNTGQLQNNSDLSGPAGTQLTATNNLVVSSTLPLPLSNIVDICPRLDVLTDNGGYTQTHGLKSASPAIDNGNAGNLTTDQRGAPRPSGIAADVGALERQPTDVEERILTSGFDGFCDQ